MDRIKKIIYLSIVILFVVSVIIIRNLLSEKEDSEIVFDSYSEPIEIESVDNTFFVDVKGAVKKPGVYEVKTGMIVNDAISLAGGLKSSAITSNINLSEDLHKGMVIYVFNKNELEKSTIPNTCVTNVIEIKECSRDENDFRNNLVNINTATLEELMTLTGIGEAKANSIIEYRNQKKFETKEEIMNISGIGASAFEKIKDNFTV